MYIRRSNCQDRIAQEMSNPFADLKIGMSQVALATADLWRQLSKLVETNPNLNL